jgi:hypothetical protein
MKTIIIIALSLLITGCQALKPYEFNPVVDNRTHEQKVSDDCLKYFGGECNALQKEQVEYAMEAEYKEARQNISDMANGTGKYANDALIQAIDENTRRTNNNLMWLRIENGMRR